MPRRLRSSAAGVSSSQVSTQAVPRADNARGLEHLERAVTVALSPLDYSDPAAWATALTATLCSLANADAGAFLLPGVAQAYWLWELWPATGYPSHPLAVLCAAWLALLAIWVIAVTMLRGRRALLAN